MGSALSEVFLNISPPFFLIIFFQDCFFPKSNFKGTTHKKTPRTLQASGLKQKISQVADDAFENVTAPLLSFHLHSLEPLRSESRAKIRYANSANLSMKLSKLMTLSQNGLTGENRCSDFPQLCCASCTALRN